MGIPLLLYVLLCLPSVHDKIRRVASDELSEFLGAEVSIGKLNVVPFNRLELGEVSIAIKGDTVLRAAGLNAGISARNLLRGRIVVTDVELMHPDIRLWRQAPDSALNVQPILDRLKGKDEKKPKAFDLAVHTVVIRAGRASYDVLSEPEAESGLLDANHLAIDELRADLTAPKISNERIIVSLKRLNFRERSGLTLKDLAADVEYADGLLRLNGLRLRLPETRLDFADMVLALNGERKLADIELLEGSAVNPADLSALLPPLTVLDTEVGLSLKAELFTDSVSLKSLSLGMPSHRLHLAAGADASANEARLGRLEVGFNGERLLRVADALWQLPQSRRELIGGLGDVTFRGAATWRAPLNVSLNGSMESDIGNVEIDAELSQKRLAGTVDASELNLGLIVPGKELGMADLAATFDLAPRSGRAALSIDRLGWRGHNYSGAEASMAYSGKRLNAMISMDDSLATVTAHASVDLTPGAFSAEVMADVDALHPFELGLWNKYEGYSVSGEIRGQFTGSEPMRPVGQLTVSNLRFTDATGHGLLEAPVRLSADLASVPSTIEFSSDLIDASARGEINLKTIGAAANNILALAMPQHFRPKPTDPGLPNDFTLTAEIHDDAPIMEFVKAPVKLLYPISISGELSELRGTAGIDISAPYIQQGHNLISETRLSARAGAKSELSVHTKMPSKFGDMDLTLTGNMTHGDGHATIKLNDLMADAYSGLIDIAFRPTADGASMQIEESTFNFGDGEMNWTLTPALIEIAQGRTSIHGLSLVRPGQELTIHGNVSKSADDVLTVNLDKINLDNIFAALRLNDVVQFGGIASGTITGAGLLGSEPILQTNNLFVKDLSYSHCLMGDARLRSRWNHETRGIELHAGVDGKVADGGMVVDGVIYPLTQELDFKFNARHAPLGFLHTFMSAWASKVGGYASGSCHLYGDFKLVDLVGDFYAENFALTVGFTNVTYYATDSVHVRPGRIALDGIKIRDSSGRTAKVTGLLTHKKFQEPRFEFNVTDMDRILAYDIPPSIDSFWSGKIRANGSVTITGAPGHVDIGANVSTAPESEFTFELTDNESATEYNFLTFNDATPRVRVDSIPPQPGSPELDRIMRERVRKEANRAMLTSYDFNLQMDITPDIKMTLVMDPVAGDKITAFGSGHVGLLYDSGNDEMRLYGEYKIDRGEYNFSLQDIILKNFTISEGSTVAFHGDPNDATLDITAVHQTNGNLSDLDESFLNDKEVQRTRVPVNAVLNVDGHLQDPQISFDIDFPSLTPDVKRKVRSIVNTEEMMNRQIIYLLALNRFYTPEYMTTTKGNELMSVASGTISSQLSNILGQLSDKISVAPSLRSDAEDFSDLEFDVALSSTLLNNRLLLNGNFGYRDKALNSNNQFIGDFDVEYLLNRAGNWRLKAYNHFNDRNLYVKTAMTTQGLGLVFKHDFDRLFLRRPKIPQNNNVEDSVGGDR